MDEGNAELFTACKSLVESVNQQTVLQEIGDDRSLRRATTDLASTGRTHRRSFAGGPPAEGCHDAAMVDEHREDGGRFAHKELGGRDAWAVD